MTSSLDFESTGPREPRARFASAVLSALLLTAPGLAAHARDDGACVYDRRFYAAGTEMCQGSQRVRCEAGAWADVGLCDGDEPAPEPITSGGDRDDLGERR